MEYFLVRNWRKFQHYRDRNPPWIKLHFELLSSESWVMLDDSSRVLAVACMLIASRNDGKVPNNSDYLKRVAYLNKPPNFKPLIDIGFLEPASDCKQMLADARPETETETETEKNRKPQKAAFTPPTIEQVQSFISEHGYPVDASRFVDFYESKGWMVGKNKMKDWKASVRTWSKGSDSKKPVSLVHGQDYV